MNNEADNSKENELAKKMIDAPGRYRITIRKGDAPEPGVDVDVDAFILATKDYATGMATGQASATTCATPKQAIKVFMEIGEASIKAAAAIANDIAAHGDLQLKVMYEDQAAPGDTKIIEFPGPTPSCGNGMAN